MKITKKQLQQIIKEEVEAAIKEVGGRAMAGRGPNRKAIQRRIRDIQDELRSFPHPDDWGAGGEEEGEAEEKEALQDELHRLRHTLKSMEQ